MQDLFKGLPGHVRKLRDSAKQKQRLKQRKEFKERVLQPKKPSV